MTSARGGARLAVVLAATLTTVAGAALVVTGAQAAAPGCRVDYRVTSQWPGGFGADVTITNLGDPVTGWTLAWSYAAGQTVTQAWNASVSQSGTRVTATNASYNGSLGTGAAASFGFNGAFTGTNPAPTSFTLNGTACTGAPTTPAPTTPAPTTPAPT
ncbi:cellulose-binding domain-containing protein, partial [Micromonospora aurantiaca (nom. illeg.)]